MGLRLPPRPLIAIVGGSLVALFVATALFASVYHEQRAVRALTHLERGHTLAAAGELESAVREYRAALSLERDSIGAEQALALTLLSLNRLSEAESYLTELLARDPASGPLNRAIARIHASRGDETQARGAYQRAIYGQWPEQEEAAGERIATRFELVRYLRTRSADEEVLAELLRLKAELSPAETASIRRVASLFTQLNAGEEAIEALEAAAEEAPRDVELLAQLADTQAAIGQSTAARTTLRRALAVEPRRADLRDRVAVIERVLALDPTLPRLRLSTRTLRARQLLAAVVAQTRACLEEAAPPESVARDQAARRLRLRRPSTVEGAEEELALALRLWSASPACQEETPEARAIAQIMARVQVPEEPLP